MKDIYSKSFITYFITVFLFLLLICFALISCEKENTNKGEEQNNTSQIPNENTGTSGNTGSQMEAFYPRLGGMLIGDPHNYNETSYQQQIAKLDLAILGMYNTWNIGGVTPSEAVNSIKALNPDILLGNYTIMTEVSSGSDPATQYLRDKLFAEVGPNSIGDWWAYDALGQHTDWSQGGYNSWDTNLTLFTTPDSEGNYWSQWLAQAQYHNLLEGVDFDIWYCDNNFWRPRSDADWDRDGNNDSADAIEVRNWWRNGQRAYYDTAKNTAPNLSVMVNADSDLDGTVFPANADPYDQYKNEVHGAFMERVMGENWSVETWGGWEQAMAWYQHLATNLLEPNLIVFDVYLENPADYQYVRYSFASCLIMGNGYFSASTDYNEIKWFDEYDLAGTKDSHWLGNATDGPQTEPWQNGVYRRNFENGTVLVNPKGNGPQTVTIEPGYIRFLGNQAPHINNGQSASSITLNDRDGLFLVKEIILGL